MQFLWPSALPLLLLVPILIASYVLAQRRRQRYVLRYSSVSLVRDALRRGPGLRRHIPPALFVLGLTTLLFALARPFAWATVPSLGATVILTLDVSGSMRADDLKPSRFEAAKTAARAFVEKQSPTTRIGIVSFSGVAALVQAPTIDHEAVLESINRLTTARATAIGSGILTSLDAVAEALGADVPSAQPTPLVQTGRAPTPSGPTPTPVPKGSYAPAIIVLLSDGQNTTGPAPLDAAQQAVNRGIRIYTIGVGTPQGAVLNPGGGGGGFGGSGGGGGFFRAQLDEVTLRKIAKMTDAKYYYAATETDLREIYESLDASLIVKPQQMEVTSLVMSVGAGFLLLGGVLSLWWFNRLP